MKSFKKSRICIAVVLLGLLALSGLGQHQETLAQGGVQLVYSRFVPQVVPVDRTEPVLLEAQITGFPSRVVLAFETTTGTTDVALNDQGTDGDRIAFDGIYSALLPPQEITQQLREDDVFRVFTGFLSVFQGNQQLFRGNIFAEVITPDIPLLPVTQRNSIVQHTDYLINIVNPNFDQDGSFTEDQIAQTFYQNFGDDYDFLNIVSSLNHFRNRYHFAVKNETFGIGLGLFNNTTFYGSFGRLQGITTFPNTIFFDGAEEGYIHELAHQWIMFLEFPPFGPSVPHWPLSTMASGIMGWSDPNNGQGLAFPCNVTVESGGVRLTPRQGPAFFTDMDLYLMGLMSADEVGPHFVFADQDPSLITQCNGGLYQGDLIPVSLNDVALLAGPRAPDVVNSQKQFKIATIIVSPEPLSEDAMAFYSFFAKRAALEEEVLTHSGFAKGTGLPFLLATDGRALLDVCLFFNCSN